MLSIGMKLPVVSQRQNRQFAINSSESTGRKVCDMADLPFFFARHSPVATISPIDSYPRVTADLLSGSIFRLASRAWQFNEVPSTTHPGIPLLQSDWLFCRAGLSTATGIQFDLSSVAAGPARIQVRGRSVCESTGTRFPWPPRKAGTDSDRH